MKRICLLMLIPLIFSGCNVPSSEPEVSAKIVGEWKSEEIISSGTIGEIDGNKYLFLMTFGGPMPWQTILHVLDLHDPAEPVEVAVLDAPVESFVPVGALELSGNMLYIPMGGGMWVVDVSDPASPWQISLLDAQYPAIDLALCGNVAYIAGFASHRFLLVDVTDPLHPQHAGEFWLSREQDVYYHNQKTYVSGSLLYVTDRDGLDIVDVSLPSSPREVSFYANPLWTGEEPEAVENLQGITRIEKISGIEDLLPEGFHDVVVSGEYAYIPDSKVGLRVLGVSNPALPQEVAQLSIPEAAYHVTVSNNLLYLLGMELIDRSILHTIHIIDISEPESPVIVDSVEDISGLPPYQFLVATERYIYFVNLKTVLVIDVYASDE